MINYALKYGTVDADKIIINKNELSQRLGTSRNFEHSLIDLCINDFKKVVEYKYAYRCVPINFRRNNICDLGFGEIVSENLYKTLRKYSSAIILGVTTGINTDRLLNRLSVTSMSKHYITDAVASAAVESFCDYMDDRLRINPRKKRRFSPGYGDLSLDIQPDILNMLNASNTLGITINKSLLMTPVKSITAIMGVYNE